MKIRLCFVIAIFFVAMLLSGCSNNEPIGDISNYSSVSDPMNAHITLDNPGTKVLGSYGHNFKDDDIDFSGRNLKFTPTVTGDENPTTLGAMAFVDGLPQEFSIDGSTLKATLSLIETTPSTVEYTLVLDAEFDKSFEIHYAAMLYILEPNFIPERDTSFGVYHSGSHWVARQIDTDGKEVNARDVRAYKAENAPFTANQIEKYNINTDDTSGVVTYFDLYDSSNSGIVSLQSGNTAELTFAAYTTGQYDSGNYRITFYKNHELCNFNNGYNCLDMTLEGGKIVEEKIVLNDLHEGDFVYCIAMPLFEGGLTDKSTSRMIYDTENDNSGDIGSISSSETENGVNLVPEFVIGETLYYLDNRDEMYLCMSKNGDSIDKTVQINDLSQFSHHGEYISVICDNHREITAKLYDKSLNEIKSVNLDELQIFSLDSVDFDLERIVYAAITENGLVLCSCDWSLQNKKVLMELPCKEYPLASYFDGISLAKDFVAFSAYGREGDTRAGFYGICDFSGNYEIRRKDGINAPQTNSAIAIWQDKHTNTNSGEMPSGKIEIYENGSFLTLQTNEIIESHRVFLSDSGAIITSAEGGTWSLRKYLNGKLTKTINTSENAFIANAVEYNGKIYAYISEYSPITQTSTSKCVVWEVD